MRRQRVREIPRELACRILELLPVGPAVSVGVEREDLRPEDIQGIGGDEHLDLRAEHVSRAVGGSDGERVHMTGLT